MAEHTPKRSAARKFSPSADVFKGIRTGGFTGYVKGGRTWSASEGGPAQQPGPKSRGK